MTTRIRAGALEPSAHQGQGWQPMLGRVLAAAYYAQELAHWAGRASHPFALAPAPWSAPSPPGVMLVPPVPRQRRVPPPISPPQPAPLDQHRLHAPSPDTPNLLPRRSTPIRFIAEALDRSILHALLDRTGVDKMDCAEEPGRVTRNVVDMEGEEEGATPRMRASL